MKLRIAILLIGLEVALVSATTSANASSSTGKSYSVLIIFNTIKYLKYYGVLIFAYWIQCNYDSRLMKILLFTEELAFLFKNIFYN